MLYEITPLFLHYAHNQPSKMCIDHRRSPVNLVTVAKEMITSLILRNYNEEHQPSIVAKWKKHISGYEHIENSHSVLIENCQSERKMWVVFVKQSECQQGQRCNIVLPCASNRIHICKWLLLSAKWRMSVVDRLSYNIKQQYMHTSHGAVRDLWSWGRDVLSRESDQGF